MHPAAERHWRTVVDLQIAIVKHAELEDRNGLHRDAQLDGGSTVRRIFGVDANTHRLLEREQAGVGAARDHPIDGCADDLRLLREREARQRGRSQAGDIAGGDDAITHGGVELRHDLVAGTFSGIGHLGGLQIDAGCSRIDRDGGRCDADQRPEQHQEEERGFKRESTTNDMQVRRHFQPSAAWTKTRHTTLQRQARPVDDGRGTLVTAEPALVCGRAFGVGRCGALRVAGSGGLQVGLGRASNVPCPSIRQRSRQSGSAFVSLCF